MDAGVIPVLYYVADLNKDPIQQSFYKEQLTKAPNPYNKNHFYDIEKVLKTKYVKGKKYRYVKFLHYPNKFNAWISQEDFIENRKS